MTTVITIYNRYYKSQRYYNSQQYTPSTTPSNSERKAIKVAQDTCSHYVYIYVKSMHEPLRLLLGFSNLAEDLRKRNLQISRTIKFT